MQPRMIDATLSVSLPLATGGMRVSPLADAADWVDVDGATRCHGTLPGVCGLGDAIHDGYGSWPLAGARGRIPLAEFGHGGKRLPSFPSWLIDGTRPSHLARLLKERMAGPDLMQ